MLDYLKLDTAIICNNDFSEANLKNTFDFFTRNGFNNFIFLYDFDFDVNYPSTAIRNMKIIRDRLKALKPIDKHITAKARFNFIMTEDLLNNQYVDQMNSAKRCKQIFLHIPAFYNSECVSPILHQLLYRKKLTPVFTSFDKNIATCDEVYLDKFVFKSTAGIFAFDFNYFFSNTDSVNNIIRKSIIQNISLTVCFSGELSDYAGISKVLYNFKSKNSKDYCIDLFRHLYKSSNLLLK